MPSIKRTVSVISSVPKCNEGNVRFTTVPTKLMCDQEIYRPGTAISDASNLCTAVGGDQNKEIRGNASFVRGEGVNMKILLL